MKPKCVEQKEMELRQNQDLIASLNMVAEGAPIYFLDHPERADFEAPLID